MEKLSNFDDTHDVDYHPSSYMDNSSPFSTLSGDSFSYYRAWKSSDDNSYSSEPSPCCWTAAKIGPKQTDLSRVGMKLCKNSVDDKHDECDSLDSASGLSSILGSCIWKKLKLEPLKPEKKAMWRREMKVLLSVCDYIVEFAPTAQYLEDGTIIEEIFDTFKDAEFWYAENISDDSTPLYSTSFRRIVHINDENWWVPDPCVLLGGLSDKSRKNLIGKQDCAKQIYKAAMEIYSNVLAEIDIPETYIEILPKNGRTSVGNTIYNYMYTTDKFSPDRQEYLKINSEHEAFELADKVESSMYTWRYKSCMSHSKSSWNEVKDLMADTVQRDKKYTLAEKAESLLFCLKQDILNFHKLL
ncbi:unnamed protein product [Lupinus luteus]|uniref:PRONE domain-containing protein n=1 Tax=Lupinus luteus TaxID=3873 RepID=A0AAV1W2C6_LUPLU